MGDYEQLAKTLRELNALAAANSSTTLKNKFTSVAIAEYMGKQDIENTLQQRLETVRIMDKLERDSLISAEYAEQERFRAMHATRSNSSMSNTTDDDGSGTPSKLRQRGSPLPMQVPGTPTIGGRSFATPASSPRFSPSSGCSSMCSKTKALIWKICSFFPYCLWSILQNKEDDLTRVQRFYFWAGFLLPLPSIALYVLEPSETIRYFGGEPSPTAAFWCSIASSGDAMFAALSASVLTHPSNAQLRRSVLFCMCVYGVFHFGGFLRAHYTLTAHPQGHVRYIFRLVIILLAYLCWGREKKTAVATAATATPATAAAAGLSTDAEMQRLV